MLIVSAKVYVDPVRRDEYVTAMADFVRETRQEPGCLDVVIAADPVEPDRINTVERWESRATLDAFRARANPPDTGIAFLRTEGAIYEIASEGPLFPEDAPDPQADTAGAMTRPHMSVPNPVLGAPDPQVLGAFYAELLGWTVIENEHGWVSLEAPEARCPNAWHGLSIQREEHWVPPVWPAQPGRQQMTMHLDIGVDDLEQGVAWALEVGATLADIQPQHDVRVLRDPAGNPFCLYPRAG